MHRYVASYMRQCAGSHRIAGKYLRTAVAVSVRMHLPAAAARFIAACWECPKHYWPTHATHGTHSANDRTENKFTSLLHLGMEVEEKVASENLKCNKELMPQVGDHSPSTLYRTESGALPEPCNVVSLVSWHEQMRQVVNTNYHICLLLLLQR